MAPVLDDMQKKLLILAKRELIIASLPGAEEGLRIAEQCIANGWLEFIGQDDRRFEQRRYRITPAGQDALAKSTQETY